jgi:hypothetical protein
MRAARRDEGRRLCQSGCAEGLAGPISDSKQADRRELDNRDALWSWLVVPLIRLVTSPRAAASAPAPFDLTRQSSPCISVSDGAPRDRVPPFCSLVSWLLDWLDGSACCSVCGPAAVARLSFRRCAAVVAATEILPAEAVAGRSSPRLRRVRMSSFKRADGRFRGLMGLREDKRAMDGRAKGGGRAVGS